MDGAYARGQLLPVHLSDGGVEAFRFTPCGAVIAVEQFSPVALHIAAFMKGERAHDRVRVTFIDSIRHLMNIVAKRFQAVTPIRQCDLFRRDRFSL